MPFPSSRRGANAPPLPVRPHVILRLFALILWIRSFLAIRRSPLPLPLSPFLFLLLMLLYRLPFVAVCAALSTLFLVPPAPPPSVPADAPSLILRRTVALVLYVIKSSRVI